MAAADKPRCARGTEDPKGGGGSSRLPLTGAEDARDLLVAQEVRDQGLGKIILGLLPECEDALPGV